MVAARVASGKAIGAVQKTTKKTSQARKPAASVNGDKVTSSKGMAEKKKYDSAKTDQERYDIRSAAKKAGIDVKEWS